MLPLVASLLIFLAVAATTYAIYARLAVARDPMAARLRALRMQRLRPGPGPLLRRPPLLLKLIAMLGGFMPAREGTNALRTGLVRAGFRRADAPLVFTGCKILLAVALPIAGAGVVYALGQPISKSAGGLALLAMVGFYVPTFFIARRQKARRMSIMAALPDALDLMVVCVEAGLGIAAALQRVADEVHMTSPALSDELALVNREIQTGLSRTDALRHLAERTGVEAVHGLVAMLVQTDRLGTSVAQSLRVHADSMRTRRRQRAEQLARQAAIKLAFPLVFLVLPALLIVILGPAAIQLVKALAIGEP